MATNRKSRNKIRKVQSSAQDRALGMMHQVWLAGLGAVSKARNGAPELLEDLVAEGARVQADTRGAAQEALGSLVGEAKATINARVKRMRAQAGKTYDDLEKTFQSRVHRALNQLGVPSSEEIGKLGSRVDMLNKNLDRLARKRSLNGTRRSAAGR